LLIWIYLFKYENIWLWRKCLSLFHFNSGSKIDKINFDSIIILLKYSIVVDQICDLMMWWWVQRYLNPNTMRIFACRNCIFQLSWTSHHFPGSSRLGGTLKQNHELKRNYANDKNEGRFCLGWVLHIGQLWLLSKISKIIFDRLLALSHRRLL